MHPIIEHIRCTKVNLGRHLYAYCTAARPIRFIRRDRPAPEGCRFTEGVWPKGTTLKIVMTSRFGDIGLTDRLDATSGYEARVFPEDGQIRDVRWEVAG